MKKIMFNDKYGLTDAVLDGSKTMTRRPVGKRMTEDDIKAYLKGYTDLANKCAQYKIGEVVAVAQAYKDIAGNAYFASQCAANEESVILKKFDKGWDNKMFVAAYYMPHKIRITDIKVERLQDISNEDCLKEGVWKDESGGRNIGVPFGIPFYYTFNNIFSKNNQRLHWTTPREAFAVLIDKVCGKGTWECNPWVFAYSFELVK